MINPEELPDTFAKKFILDHEDLVARVQKLVDQYHVLSKEVTHISDKIPVDLDKRIISIEFQLERIVKDIESEFITQKDFAVYKVEHAQMKRLMWGFVIMVLTSVVGAVLALVVNNVSIIK